jgi:hypothetical protein
MGVPVIYNLNELVSKLKTWIAKPNELVVDFPDETSDIISNMVAKYSKR